MNGHAIRLLNENTASLLSDNAALRAANAELLRSARAAWHLTQSLLAERTGATDDLIQDVADALHAAIQHTEGR